MIGSLGTDIKHFPALKKSSREILTSPSLWSQFLTADVLCVPSELLALLQAQHGTETAGKVKKIADPGCFMINRKILL